MTNSIDKRYRRWYSDDAAHYDTRFANTAGRLFADYEDRLIVDLLSPLDGLRILDVGTGTGRASLALAKATNASVVGLDLTPAMLEQASLKRTQAGLEGPDFVCGNGRKLPFPDSSFDCVTSIRMLHLMPTSEVAFFLDEMVRVLRPGGQLLVEFNSPFAGCGWVLPRELLRKLKGSKQRYYLWPWKAQHLVRTLEDIKIVGFWFPGIGRVAPLSRRLRWVLTFARLDPPRAWLGNTVLVSACKPD